jgi:hypothetical protein
MYVSAITADAMPRSALCVVRCARYVRCMWDGVEQGRGERSEERGARSEECKAKAKSREGQMADDPLSLGWRQTRTRQSGQLLFLFPLVGPGVSLREFF